MKLKKRNSKIIEIYLSFCKGNNRSDHSIINYRQDLKKFFIWYQDKYLLPYYFITHRKITKYREFLASPNDQGKILAVGTRKRHLCSLNNFFQFLIEARPNKIFNLRKNPVLKKLHQITLKDEDINHTKILKNSSFYSLMDKLSRPKDILIILLLYKGGLRLKELRELTIESINKEGRIEIIRKRGKRQNFVLQDHKEILYYLEKYLGQRKRESNWLFPGQDLMKPITTRALYQHLLKLLKKYSDDSKKVGPHGFRKACATNLYHQTKDLLLVRNYLGHTDAKVTQTYIEY